MVRWNSKRKKGTPKSAKKGNIAHYLLSSIKVRSSGCSQIELLTESASLNFQRTSTHWPTTSSDKWPAPGGHSRSQALIRLQEKKKKQSDGNDDDRHWKQIETGRRKSMSVQSCCTNWLYALIKLIGWLAQCRPQAMQQQNWPPALTTTTDRAINLKKIFWHSIEQRKLLLLQTGN